MVNFIKSVQDTLACSAFAEAGEPCPIGDPKEHSPEEKTATPGKTFEQTMACSAFAEAGEPCPIGKDE